MDKTPFLWREPVAVADLPDEGAHIELTADEATRAGLAETAGLRSLPRLSAAFDLFRAGEGVKVTGRVRGLVGQTCVVSLEPMESEVDEEIDLIFQPPSGPEAKSEASTYQVSLDRDPPEPLVGGAVDLGALATEYLMLGVDPYPRKPGAQFAAPQIGDPVAKPFAALAALKKKSGDEPA